MLYQLRLKTISVSCVVKETCVLPCRFEYKEKDLHNIEWYKYTDGSLVHALKDGADLLERQAEAFRKRTSMFPEQVSRGNASVQLSAVRTEDEGLYLCRVHKISYEDSDVRVNLRVEAPVKAVTLEQRGDVLVCSSEGIYPLPNISWSPPSEHQTQEKPMKDGFYSVSSSLPLDHPSHVSTLEGIEISLPVSLLFCLIKSESCEVTVFMVPGVRKCEYGFILFRLSYYCRIKIIYVCVSDSCEFFLEPNTAHKNLLLSEDNRTATYVWEEQPYPYDMDRFTDWEQVLSSSAVTGRCYFEVDCSGRRCDEAVSIAVSYKRIKRTGEGRDCEFGGVNDLSWSLTIRDNHYIARHNDTETLLSSTFSLRVGVFLDSEAGVLSFYQVLSDGQLSHLHTFNTSFTEPLFPGFEDKIADTSG
uniref:Ig-like domain-containing protein n=1 Tax=Neogobius melanostomus TaxID=47308 RepID=A0A8C6SQ35_9GOBI